MRRLILTRGHQGTGKTTFLRAQGLGPYRLSADDIRLLLSSPVMDRRGVMGASHDHERRVWGMLYDVLEERMGRGELVCIDATHRKSADFKRYLKLAQRHRYQVACVDFSTVPLETALAQNREREAHAIVPEGVLRRFWEEAQRGQVPEAVHRIEWREDGAHAQALEAWLDVPIRDLSGYRQVVHIGDLQGCLDPLVEYLGEEGLREDTFYVLVGDLCDRGMQNGEVVRWALQATQRENVVLLWGNHEDHLHRWVTEQSCRSDEFELRTLPQLLEAGITKEDVDGLCGRIAEMLWYRWQGHQVLVTHAGLPTVPERPALIAKRQYSHGTGYYADPVDADFSEHGPADWVQVHGHRNIRRLPSEAAPRSYNLEGQIEHGGHLRVLELDARGFTPVEVANRLYKPIWTRLAEGSAQAPKMFPQWAFEELPPPGFEPEAFEALRHHELVAEKPCGSLPHISAFNFTRDAFFGKAWDEVTTRARGLFVNTDTREIVARSYDKFFNLDERPETQIAALQENLVFPIDAWVKENGYLGIVGYDAERESLFCASKSTPDGDYADWFRELLHAQVSPGHLEAMRRYLRDCQASLAFEVIDPVRDPHICEYDEAQLVLLDIIRRAPAFERASANVLQKAGKFFDLPVKERGMRFERWENFAGWLKKAEDPEYLFGGRAVEGFVIEDSAGFQVKIKLEFYAFWKRMRGLKQRVASTRGSGRPLGRDISDPRVKAFHDWCQKLPAEVLAEPIIQLRRRYLEGEVPPGTASSSWGVPPKPDKRIVGFERALAGLLKMEVIKPGTADVLVRRALADDQMMSILRSHEARRPLIMAATPGEDRQAAAEAVGLDID